MTCRRFLVGCCLVAFLVAIPACSEEKPPAAAQSTPDNIKANVKTTMPKTKVE